MSSVTCTKMYEEDMIIQMLVISDKFGKTSMYVNIDSCVGCFVLKYLWNLSYCKDKGLLKMLILSNDTMILHTTN